MSFSVDTPVPTPGGLMHVRNLQAGDMVLDELGYACSVVSVSEPYMVDTVYDVQFGWGKKKYPEKDSSLICTPDQKFCTIGFRNLQKIGNPSERSDYRHFTSKIDAVPHNWPVWRPGTSASAKPIAREVSVEDISDSIRYERKHGSHRPTKYYLNHSIPTTIGINVSASGEMPVHPYVLGVALNYWNVEKRTLKISLEWLPYFREKFAAYEELELIPVTPITDDSPRSKHIECEIPGLHHRLWNNGIMRPDRKIPMKYLRAAEPDRLLLLAGLTDVCFAQGSVLVRARTSMNYTHSDPMLVHSVRELLITLGFPAYLLARLEKNKQQWVEWHPVEPPQAHPKLRVRHIKDTDRKGNDFERYIWKIYSADRIEEKVVVRDIEVSSARGMLLVGNLYLPVLDSKGLRQ